MSGSGRTLAGPLGATRKIEFRDVSSRPYQLFGRAQSAARASCASALCDWGRLTGGSDMTGSDERLRFPPFP
jgi:hypothetical protein